MGNAIISTLLFQPPMPPNELDYFGNNLQQRNSSNAGGNAGSRHPRNDHGNEAATKSQDDSVRGGRSRDHHHHHPNNHHQQRSGGGQVVALSATHEPTLHYLWLLSPNSNTPIPALHIKHHSSTFTTTSNNNNDNSSSPLSPTKSSSPSYTPSSNRYTLLYSHGNAEDIGLLSKFLTDISRLLQVDILVYDYRGYGVGVDKCAILRFLAVWGEEIDEWKRWRKGLGSDGVEERDGSSRSSGGGKRWRVRRGGGGNDGGGVMYSDDVFMAPMVFPKGTTATTNTTTSSGKQSSSSATLNLPDNVYVCGNELDFIIEDDTTTIASGTASSSNDRRQDSSLLDIDDDDVPSVTATCYENSTLYGEDDEYYEEDEVSLFTCGASCNEVEHTSILAGVEDKDETTTEFSASTLSSSYPHPHPQRKPSTSDGSTTTTCTPSQLHLPLRRRRSSNKKSTPLTPKQKRRALLRKYKWTTPSPSEEQCYGDILLAYNYLLQIEEVPSKHVVLYGKSVGSGPTCWLAQRTCQQSGNNTVCSGSDVAAANGMMYEDVRDDGNVDYRFERRGVSGGCDKSGDDDVPGGVVLHSPFLSVIRVVLDMGFTTLGDLFPNIDRLKDLTCPVYIIHGTEDEIVPFYHGQGLYNGLPDTSKVVPFWAKGARHNNIEMEMPTAYIKRLMQFIRQCDRLNYPAGGLQRSRAFSSGSGSGTSHSSVHGGSSQKESDTVLPHRKHTRLMSASKHRKKKGTLVMKCAPETAAERRSSSIHPTSPTSVTMTSTVNTNERKRRQGITYRSNNYSRDVNNSMEEQDVVHDKYHQPQQYHQQIVRDQYPS